MSTRTLSPPFIAMLAMLLCAASQVPVAAGAAGAAGAADTVRVMRWSDGDTVVTTAGKVRLIGVDTPEVGQCGYAKASRLARRMAPAGSVVRLINPRGVSDLDGYDRSLRYVMVGRTDVGLRQIRRGAKARYDGYDGMNRHPRQRRYRTADRRNPDHCVGGKDLKSYPPASDMTCPRHAPIKGNVKSGDPDWREPYRGIYHLPGQDYYAITSPEQCFASEAGAAKAGFRRAYS